MEPAEDTGRSVHDKLRSSLEEMGHVGEETVPPTGQKPPFAEAVERLGGEVIHAADSLAEGVTGGKGIESGIRTTAAKGPRRWVAERLQNMIRFRRQR